MRTPKVPKQIKRFLCAEGAQKMKTRVPNKRFPYSELILFLN